MFKKVVLFSLLVVSAQPMFAKKKCKDFCKIIAKKAVIDCLVAGNETVTGLLTANNATITGALTLATGSTLTLGSGTTIITPSGATFGSIIPYASGLVTLGSTAFPAGLPTSGLVMAFGSSNVQGTVDPGVTVTNSAFAFDVPAAGTLHNLQVSVDSIYAIGAPATPFTFTFTVLRSHCTAGSLTAYTSTGISATASTTAPTAPITVLTGGGAGCGSSSASVAVTPGDRIVVLVTPNVAIPATTLANLAFSAGLVYTPA